jgi:hypothetical protein
MDANNLVNIPPATTNQANSVPLSPVQSIKMMAKQCLLTDGKRDISYHQIAQKHENRVNNRVRRGRQHHKHGASLWRGHGLEQLFPFCRASRFLR